MMLPASGHVNTGPMMLGYAKDTQWNWPHLKTETQLMVELTEKENCIWDMAELSCKVVGLCMRAVIESKPISRDHLRQLELEFLQQRALMKLLKPRAKKSSASERNTKRQRRKKCPDPSETASHITSKCPSATKCPDPSETASHITSKCLSATSSSGPLAMSSSKPSAMSASSSALPNNCEDTTETSSCTEESETPDDVSLSELVPTASGFQPSKHYM